MSRFKFGFFLILVALLCSSSDLVAQMVALDPRGAADGISTVHFGKYERSFDWDRTKLHFNSGGDWYPLEGDGQIYSVSEKRNSSGTLLVLTTSGHVFEVMLDVNFGYVRVGSTKEITPPPMGYQYNQCVGDALYAHTTSGQVYVTQNDTTWQIDTAGFNGTHPQYLELDTALNVYAATGSGIFEQAPTGSVWNLLPGSPTNGVFYLFVSRADVIYAPTNNGIMSSADHGVTWAFDSAGMGQELVNSISDDSVGNLYATASYGSDSNTVWMNPVGGVWKSIGAALGHLAYDSLEQVNSYILTGIAADSGIHVSTVFGLFSSYDGGVTWQPDNAGIPAENIDDYYVFPDGKRIATTSLGLFTENPGDTNWNKTFPQDSYLSGMQFFVDNSNKVYALGCSRRQTGLKGVLVVYNYYPKDIFVSTDEGLIWQPDTAGLSSIVFERNTSGSGGLFLQFVDETGTEHVASMDAPHMRLFSKSPGGTWLGDSSGYAPASGDAPVSFATDKHGSIYLAVSNGASVYELLKRPVSGGAWSVVSTSALGGTPYQFAAMKDGALIGATSDSIGYYDGSSWTAIPNAPIASAAVYTSLSVDSTNTLWMASDPKVFSTSDFGQHWILRSDTSQYFPDIVSFGDTTYCLQSGYGLYYFAPSSSGVYEPTSLNFTFSVIPNPSSGKVEVTFTLNNRSPVEVTIFDLLGRSIATPIRGSFDAGPHSGTFDLSANSPGTYYCRIQSDGIVETQPFVIQH